MPGKKTVSRTGKRKSCGAYEGKRSPPTPGRPWAEWARLGRDPRRTAGGGRRKLYSVGFLDEGWPGEGLRVTPGPCPMVAHRERREKMCVGNSWSAFLTSSQQATAPTMATTPIRAKVSWKAYTCAASKSPRTSRMRGGALT